MTSPDEAPPSLTRRLLAQTEAAATHPATTNSVASSHPDDELLAVFAEGGLQGDERTKVVNHLAECSPCRQAVSRILALIQEEQEESAAIDQHEGVEPVKPRVHGPGIFRSRATVRRWLALGAIALSLLLMLAIGYERLRLGGWTEEEAYQQARSLLEAGKFDEVSTLLDEYRRTGNLTERLRSLDGQAARRMPAAIALARSGTLADFGHDVGGVVARDPAQQKFRTGLKQAGERLPDDRATDLEALLNRGHLHLTLGELAEARELFARVTESSPDSPFAWLGLGLAAYLQEDYGPAESAFRAVLRLDPRQPAALFNLALTLDETGRSDAARPIWRRLLAEEIPANRRAKIVAWLAAQTRENAP